VGALLPSALPQPPQAEPPDTKPYAPQQPGGRGANSFLEVGKIYEFTPAPNRQSFQRGEQWVRVDIAREGGGFAAGPVWVNLQHIAYISDATGGRNLGRFPADSGPGPDKEKPK
jgi:hypothetical protein